MTEREALATAIEAIAARFRSGNRIPVDKAVVPASEWSALVAALAQPVDVDEEVRGHFEVLDLENHQLRQQVKDLQRSAVQTPPAGSDVTFVPRADYAEAFFELAKLMDIASPQPVSPERVWREQLLPRLRAALARPVAAEPEQDPAPFDDRKDAERWRFVLDHAVSGKAPKDKGFDITYVPVGHNGSEWGRIEIEWRGAKWEHITADGVNAIIDAARAALPTPA